jgi:hypothetical protein
MALMCDRCGRTNQKGATTNFQVESVDVAVNKETHGRFGMSSSWDLCAICRDGLIKTIREFCETQPQAPEPDKVLPPPAPSNGKIGGGPVPYYPPGARKIVEHRVDL